MYDLVLIVHVVISCALIGLILIQQGKGAGIGAAFGSGASQTIFGSQGSGSFLTRVTSTLSIIFFATSLSLSYIAANNLKHATGIQLPDGQSIQVQKQTAQADAPVIDEVPATSTDSKK